MITIRKADQQDLDLLFTICRKSYSENFASHWKEGGLEWYLEKVYGREVIKSELPDPNINYFIAFMDDKPAGFMKLKLKSRPEHEPSRIGVEVEKLYFRPKFQGMGFGRKLINQAIDRARETGSELVWLDVIDSNTNAIAFYQTMGFQIEGKTRLDLPYFKEELKDMWIMCKNLKQT